MPAPLKKLTDKSPANANLFFPSNLGSVGHYVMFKVYHTVPTNSQILSLEFGPGGFSETGLSINRPNPEVNEYIALYLPAVITNNQTTKYSDVEMGTVLSVLGKNGGALEEQVKETIKKKLADRAGAEGRALFAAEQLSRGTVVNNQIESIFETIDRRTFQFDFRMIPRSQKEATSISNIVKTFRKNMAPSIPKPENTRQMIVPSLFEMEFYSDSAPNPYLPKIGKSICTACNIAYGGERISLYKDSHPIETSMQLTFQELEINTREKIETLGY